MLSSGLPRSTVRTRWVSASATAYLGEHWADRAAAWAVVADLKLLERHVRTVCDAAQQKGRDSGRCVALLGIGFDDGALVQLRAQVLLVDGRVVWVHSVCGVRADEERACKALLGKFRRRRGGRRCAGHLQTGQAPHHAPEQVAFGTLVGDGADLLVVEQGDCADSARLLERVEIDNGRDQCLGRAEAAHLVVDARREQELVCDAAGSWRLRVVQAQFKVLNVVRSTSKLLSKQLEQHRVVLALHRRCSDGVARARRLVQRVGQAEDRLQLVFLVEFERVVDRAVQVDRKHRHTQERPVDVHEARHEACVVVGRRHNHAAGEAEVAVEPCRPQAAAVCLDGALQVAFLAPLRHGTHAQIRRVGVCADDMHAAARRVLFADDKRNQ